MARPSDVQFVVDSRGRKKSVLLSCREYQELLEDIADLRAKAERRDETPEDLERVLADLENERRI